MTNLTLSSNTFLGRPVVEVYADNYEGVSIGHFDLDGFTYRDEQVPDYDEQLDAVRAVAVAQVAKEWIRAADRELLIDGIKTIYNCREADVDEDGRVWIADPQRGHWVDEDGLARIGRALKAGDI